MLGPTIKSAWGLSTASGMVQYLNQHKDPQVCPRNTVKQDMLVSNIEDVCEVQK